jgi:ThiF family
MVQDVSLSMTGRQYRALKAHLFPPDGKEAVAIALCGRRAGINHRLLIREIHPIAYEDCSERRRDCVTWPTDLLVPLLERANKLNYSVIKIHGHWDYPLFSRTDDAADRALFPSVDGWIDADVPHASVVLLANGGVFGRVVDQRGSFTPLERIAIVGDEIKIHFPSDFGPHLTPRSLPEFTLRHKQAFGEGTIATMQRLSVAVVGCSGTGSPVIEQLARLGVGKIVMVDPDVVEEKNLNRILHATAKDAAASKPKVSVLARAIEDMGLGTKVEAISKSLIDLDTIRTVAACDVIFGCVDSVEARYILNKIAVFYLIPYIDIGVRIEANEVGGVDQICGSVHYMQPDGASLLSRKLLTMEGVRAEGTRRRNPAAYKKLLEEKYISGAAVPVGRPAVISVNMLLAALGVNELLARLHGYRDEPNADYAVQTLSLTQGALYTEPEGMACSILSKHAGRGDVIPLLDEVELSESRQS